GVLITDPIPETQALYRRKAAELEKRNLLLEALSNSPSITSDGIKLVLMTNIELPEELDLVLKLNPDGIGLFRTEFLYLDRNSLPTEHEQYSVYKKLAESLNPRPVTIRTFDLGGDKLSHLIPGQEEQNPYLGSRGIRFSLSHPQLFETQIRAILRASIHGNIRIMFPMIVDAQDFLQAKSFVEKLMKKLEAEGISFNPAIELGAMIEIPSAAIMADELAQVCDFMSIGTNDLVQYTLATDRNNDQVADYYVQHHPAVLKLISCCIEASAKHHKSLSVCGEMASIPRYIPLLLGMGIRSFSINPHQYLSAKQLLCNTSQSTIELMRDFDPCQSRELTEKLLAQLSPNKE
ncbi:MAG: putative PEP-binding protein, partial [Candidatus Cloacimonadota bacterium]